MRTNFFLNPLTIIYFLTTAFFSSAFANSNKCDELIADLLNSNSTKATTTFFDPTLEVKTVRFTEDLLFRKPILKKTPEFHEAMRRLLLFFSNTVNENSSNKLSFEKGEMYFGTILPNGTSVEFKYEVDRRAENSRFILTKIEFRKKNMTEVEITEEPLDEQLNHLSVDGLVLAKKAGAPDSELNLVKKKHLSKILNNTEKEFDPNELKSDGDALTINDINQITEKTNNSGITQQLSGIEISLPFVIEGEILNEFVSMAEVLQDLDRPTVRKYASKGELGKLKLKGYTNYLLGNAEKVFLKQALKQIAFKGPMVAIVFLLIKLNDIERDLADLDDPDIDSVLVSQEMSEFLNAFFDKIDESENWHDTKLYNQLKKDIKVNLNPNLALINKSTEQVVNFYLKKEKHKNNINYFRADRDFSKVQKISSTEFLEKADPKSELEHILLHFPEQELVILISRSFSKTQPNIMTFQSHVVIKASKAPLLYEGLLELTEPPLNHLMKQNN
jgi:hypothetical protein